MVYRDIHASVSAGGSDFADGGGDDGGDQSVAGVTIVQTWSTRNAEAALEWAAVNNIELSRRARLRIASSYAQQNPSAAFDWANEKSTGENSRLVRTVIETTAHNDPELAMTMSREIEDQSKQFEIRRGVVQSWATNNFENAERWVRSQPAEQHDSLFASLIEGLANQDIDAAVSRIETISTTNQRDDVIARLVHHLVEQPERAHALIDEIADENKRAQATQNFQSMQKNYF